MEGSGAAYTVGPENQEEIDEIYETIICRLYRGECSYQGAAVEFEQEIRELFHASEETDG